MRRSTIMLMSFPTTEPSERSRWRSVEGSVLINISSSLKCCRVQICTKKETRALLARCKFLTQLTPARNPRAAPALVVNVFPRLGRFRSCSIFQPFFALRLRGRTRPFLCLLVHFHLELIRQRSVGCFETMTRWIDHCGKRGGRLYFWRRRTISC